MIGLPVYTIDMKELPLELGTSTRLSAGPPKIPECSFAAFTSNRRNSLRGPPMSTAPSLFPKSSAKQTEIISLGQKRFLCKHRDESSQM